ncbi:UTP--glucose-1-phosphate uridylyltransferase GalU [Salinicoccus roseus]|uniref:UTP--glucose-1-phosphate uridylyltransferase GalU n=1 Tax=Salinicoccus roseus TaxID=45670 RepID=UPI002301E037|nr:UTP--glucose-1-phosphate uridylyltransferase GalU [Salinicoccus roseus]
MQEIKKAIIPAAGLGTRFLPATKAMPKEMLPIVDKPTIQYIIEEAITSGIEDIIIVTGKGKRAIEDHFDHNFELEESLRKKGKYSLLERLSYTNNVDIHYIRQKEPKGLGHAVWCARKFVGDEPFAVLLGDDIVNAETPGIKQLINEYEKTKKSIVGVQKVPPHDVNKYGIVEVNSKSEPLYNVTKLIEKPQPDETASNLAIMGRYVFTPEIFKYLERFRIGSGGEIQLTDAIQSLNDADGVLAYKFDGKRYDVGEKLGFLKTTVEFALHNSELKEDFYNFLREKIREN